MTQEPTTADAERVDALVSGVLAVHGDRLDEEQRDALRRHVERLRQAVAQLDSYHLENADEPDADFRAIDRTDAV